MVINKAGATLHMHTLTRTYQYHHISHTHASTHTCTHATSYRVLQGGHNLHDALVVANLSQALGGVDEAREHRRPLAQIRSHHHLALHTRSKGLESHYGTERAV